MLRDIVLKISLKIYNFVCVIKIMVKQKLNVIKYHNALSEKNTWNCLLKFILRMYAKSLF